MSRSKNQVTHGKSKGQTAPAVHCHYDALENPATLVPNPVNPNQHPPEQLRVFGKIIWANGWRSAVVVSNRSGHIVKGHGAVLTALAEKFPVVPVEYQDYESAAAELEDLLADNELARLSLTDPHGLQSALKQLSAAGRDPELTGILAKLETPLELKPVSILPPPKMAWVLIGIPLVKYSRVATHIEKIARQPEALVESTFNDADQKDGQS